MSTATVHQVTVSARTIVVTLLAFAVALALAIALPLTLRTSHTVFVHNATPAQTSQTSSPGSSVATDSQMRKGDDTPIGRAQTDSQTRVADDTPIGRAETDSQTRMQR
jgi:hypothetical protein